MPNPRDYQGFLGTVLIFLVLAIAAPDRGCGQLPPDPNYVRQPIFGSYDEFRQRLNEITSIADPAIRNQRTSEFWSQLQGAGQVPFAIDNRIAFLYRGNAGSVAWRGDFNSWGTSHGQRLGASDVWLLERTLPPDARTDYKLFLNGNQWTLDPSNPLQMWSGLGPNSEVRMPEYRYPFETVRNAATPRGELSGNIRMASQRLGYEVQYRVYTPAGYSELDELPVVYVTDGHEYSADYLGSMVVVLDNLIHQGAIRPAIAVFVDPRDPNNLASNRRAQQYIANPNFAGFLTGELVPRIDGDYDTRPQAEDRTILGTSLGGLNSAYLGAVAGTTFGNLGIQSPAFWAYPAIYDLYRDSTLEPLKIFMTGGTMGDNSGARAFEPILRSRGIPYQYLEVHEGHSWGAWRGQLDQLLLATVGPPVPEPASGSLPLVAGLGALALRMTGRRRCFPIDNAKLVR